MDPTSRRLRLISLLQSREEWPGAALGELLDVSPRTLRRDVERLRDLGYAVDSSPGTDGGYRLRHGQAVPPLPFDDDEAVAVAVGLRAAAASGVQGLGDAVASALVKLETVLPARLRTRVAALGADTVDVAARMAPGRVDAELLATVAVACRRGERVELRYRDRSGNETRRDIDPFRLVRTETYWYLVARDVRRDVWRTFRVDRVLDTRWLGTRVQLGDPPDPAALVAEAVAFGPTVQTATVRFLAPADAVYRRLAPLVSDVTPDGDGTRAEVAADEPWWLARRLVSLGWPFDVLRGDALRAELHELGRQLLGAGEMAHRGDGRPHRPEPSGR